MPKNEKNEGCVSRIYDAFWFLLEEKPYAQISVSELLAHSRVSRGDFYYHYNNLADLAKSAVQAEAKNWDLLTSAFLNFAKIDIDALADQVYYCLSFALNQNSLKVKRFFILASHGNMYLLRAFREEFKYCITEYGNLDLEQFSGMQRFLFEGAIGFFLSSLAHLDLLKSLSREELRALSRKLAAVICTFASDPLNPANGRASFPRAWEP